MSHTVSNDLCARGLGIASIGIGLTELMAPQKVESMLGLEDRPLHQGILRVLGVREIMDGVSILTEKKPAAGMWSRVAGDVLDTALLGVAARKTRNPKSFAAVSAMVMAIGLADLLCARRLVS